LAARRSMMMLTENLVMHDRNSDAEGVAHLPQKFGQVDVAGILAHVAERDVEALGELYRVCAPRLFGVALRIARKRESAEDVLQDSFIKIWRFAHCYDPDRSSAMTWMATIVRNQALDHLRRLPPTDELPEDLEADSELENAGPDAALQRATDVAYLAASLQQLKPMQRQAIALAYFRGQSHSEIADTLAVPVGTVKSWIRRALSFLKAQLEGVNPPTEGGYASSPLEIADLHAAQMCARAIETRSATRRHCVTQKTAMLDAARAPF
jgi:RNA polymerase sigma-70 factor (ECF subfamily)